MEKAKATKNCLWFSKKKTIIVPFRWNRLSFDCCLYCRRRHRLQGTSSRLRGQSFLSRKSVRKKTKQVNVRATMPRAATSVGVRRLLLAAHGIASRRSHFTLSSYLFRVFPHGFRGQERLLAVYTPS